MSDTQLLDELVKDVKKSFLEDRTILSFSEYFNMVLEAPQRHLRSSSQYLLDMMDYYGREELELPTGKVERFKVFDAPFAGGEGRVVGQEGVQEALYRIIANFAREGHNNKLILLHGPNGSAKSSLVRCLMAGLEAYAHTPEGAMYTFNWIFPSERSSQDRIGFGSSGRSSVAQESYAYTPADHIDARVPSDMHDHPFFLIPQVQRAELLNKIFANGSEVENQEKDRVVVRACEYLRSGDLSYKSRCIYDALLASYDGDARKVLNHVQIERFYISRRYRRGAATIEPQRSVDAGIHQVTADRSLTALPKALQHVSLFHPTGPLVDANRGLLEFSDLLKRPVEAFKYLLSTVETATVSMESFVLHLDVVFMASTNETYLDAFKEHPDFPSFKGRMELVKVPYVLRYSDEREIYIPQITPRVVGKHVAPHAIDVAALWATLTRMRRNDHSLYPKEISEVVDTLTPMEKLKLYDTGETPERLTTREAKELRHLLGDLYRESLDYPNYEGRFGVSAREIRTALLNAAHHRDYSCLSPLAVFEEIRDILAAKGVYDFLKQEVVRGYHDHEQFLKDTQATFTNWVDHEVRESMGLASEESYLQLFSRYVTHITHWVKHEKLQDPTSGALLDPDEKFMAEIERVLMGQGEKPEDFRKSVIGTIGARSLDSPDGPPDLSVIFKGFISRLREDFYTQRRKILRKRITNLLAYTSEDQEELQSDEQEQAEQMLQHLQKKYGYTVDSAREVVAYLLKKRYAD